MLSLLPTFIWQIGNNILFSLKIMTFLPIILLAIIQGITEFLPISSSAHLILISNFIEFSNNDMALDVSLHLGTLLAVVIYFRSDVLLILNDVRTPLHNGQNLAIQILVATIPIVIIGGFIFVTGLANIFRNIQVIALATIIFGIILYYADTQVNSRTKNIKNMTYKDSFIIGFFQLLSIIPGTSRSGIVYTGGRFLGISRIESLRFAMLLSIPTILLSAFIPTYNLINNPSSDFLLLGLFGFLISFIMAYITIGILMNWIKRYSMTPFVIYRIILGSALLAYSIL